MRVNVVKLLILCVLGFGLSACATGTPRLLNVGASNDSPDEFAVLPGKPLQTPANFIDLPAPTPGGVNLTDQAPAADAIAALGGNPASVTRSGIPVTDAALLAQSRRFGVAPDIREQLSTADLALRRRQGVLFFMRWFTGNRYFAAYRGQSLDQDREFDRLSAAGVKTPSAPPRTGR